MSSQENTQVDPPLGLLREGAIYRSKIALMNAAQRLNVAQNKNRPSLYKINCMSAPATRFKDKPGVCQFALFAKAEKVPSGYETGNWIVYKLNGNHTCNANNCKRKAHDRRLILGLSQSLTDYVPNKKTKGGSVRQVIDLARATTGLELKCTQACSIVQDKRDDQVHVHIGQYHLMSSYVDHLKTQDPQGTFELSSTSATWYPGNTQPQFARLYVAHSFSKQVWKYACHPLVVCDGTFTTTGIFKQTVLLCVGLDGDNKLALLAYCICDKENEENWCYFMGKLLDDFTGIEVFVSDYDKGVQSFRFQSILELNNVCFSRCLRHMIANCAKAIDGVFTDLARRRVYQLAKARTQVQYNDALAELSTCNRQIATWFDDRKKQFSTAHMLDEGYCRYGVLLNNCAEQYNSIIKEIRTMPVLTFCVALGNYMCDKHTERYVESKRWAAISQPLTNHGMKRHYKCVDEAGKRVFRERHLNEPLYGGQVQHLVNDCPTTTLDVYVNAETGATHCPCRHSEEYGEPCYHLLCAVSKLRLPAGTLSETITQWYGSQYWTSSYVEAYSIQVPRLGLMGKLRFFYMLPPESVRTAGRPRHNRYTTRPGGVPCRACGQYGHYQKSCINPVTQVRVENYGGNATRYALKAASDISHL